MFFRKCGQTSSKQGNSLPVAEKQASTVAFTHACTQQSLLQVSLLKPSKRAHSFSPCLKHRQRLDVGVSISAGRSHCPLPLPPPHLPDQQPPSPPRTHTHTHPFISALFAMIPALLPQTGRKLQDFDSSYSRFGSEAAERLFCAPTLHPPTPLARAPFSPVV